MDSFGEWDLCSSILSLEELDFTPIIPPSSMAGIAADAWFCSMDSFNWPGSCVFGANSSARDDQNGNAIDQFLPCISAAPDHHDHTSIVSSGELEEKKIDSIFSACTDILLQEITGFCGEDRFLNMDVVETHLGNNINATANNPANVFPHKRKSTVLAEQNNLDNPNKKIRTSNNVQKSRKTTESSGNGKQKLCTRRGKCEEDQENRSELPSSDMNSCSSDNSSEDENASQDTTTNGGTLLEGDVSPPKAKTRATRGSATDPQSLYARKRRERINERLKILQKLVPNGTKVDISTMLEEAVHYVKFLQLQIKLLSSDELWMYAPIAYNGMDIGLQQKLSSFL